jgi:hypothetical protein
MQGSSFHIQITNKTEISKAATMKFMLLGVQRQRDLNYKYGKMFNTHKCSAKNDHLLSAFQPFPLLSPHTHGAVLVLCVFGGAHTPGLFNLLLL